MFCNSCGNKIEDGVKFCTSCGKPIEQATEITPTISKDVQTKVVKERKPLIAKSTATSIGIALLLAVLYAGISSIFVLLLNMSDTILVKSAFDKDMNGYLTLQEFLDILLNGNRIFNPTTVSTAIGSAVYIFIYAVPAFAGLALIAAFIGKKSVALHTVFSIMSVISAAVVAVAAPISIKLVPEIKQAIAINMGMLFEDIKAFSYTKLFIFAGVIIVLLIASCIVAGVLNKRRAK